MADVILIYPKTGFDIGAGITPPFSVLSLAAEIQDESDIKIIDQRTDSSWEKTLKKQLNSEPLCVGISSMTGLQIKFALKAAKIIRENSRAPIIWGGVHPTLLPAQTIRDKHVDFVIRGEGEKTFKELLDKFKKQKKDFKNILGLTFIKNGKIINAPPRPFIDMNTLKETPWHLINVREYFQKGVVIKDSKRELDIGETSRGCPGHCAFCYNCVFHNSTWRKLSAENTIKKIISHIKRFNLDVVWLRDDNFFVDLNRVRTIANALVKEKLDVYWYTSGITVNLVKNMPGELIKLLKESKCEGFRFGVESGSQRILNLINKNIKVKDVYSVNMKSKKYGMTPHYSFMLGFPTETMEDVYKTWAMINQLKKENNSAKIHGINLYTPYPGTPLFDLLTKKGLVPPDSLHSWSKYHHSNDFAIHLNQKQRNIIKNISDSSYLTSEPMQSAMPAYLKYALIPLAKWFEFRWNNKFFKFMPELRIINYLKKTITKSL